MQFTGMRRKFPGPAAGPEDALGYEDEMRPVGYGGRVGHSALTGRNAVGRASFLAPLGMPTMTATAMSSDVSLCQLAII